MESKNDYYTVNLDCSWCHKLAPHLLLPYNSQQTDYKHLTVCASCGFRHGHLSQEELNKVIGTKQILNSLEAGQILMKSKELQESKFYKEELAKKDKGIFSAIQKNILGTNHKSQPTVKLARLISFIIHIFQWANLTVLPLWYLFHRKVLIGLFLGLLGPLNGFIAIVGWGIVGLVSGNLALLIFELILFVLSIVNLYVLPTFIIKATDSS